MFAGVNARLDKMASAAGYQKIELRQVPDQNQVPVFDVFRIVPQLSPTSSADATLSKVPSAPVTPEGEGRTLRPGTR